MLDANGMYYVCIRHFVNIILVKKFAPDSTTGDIKIFEFLDEKSFSVSEEPRPGGILQHSKVYQCRNACNIYLSINLSFSWDTEQR